MRLEITRAGSKLLRGLAETQQRINNVLFEGVTKAEFKALCAVVDRLVTNGDRATLDLAHLIARKDIG
jgi:hypothetical protein